jgi:signal transduction histidine kinase
MDFVGRFCLFLLLLLALATAAAAQPKRVLLLHSFGPQFVPWVYFSGQFREELIKQSPYDIDLYETSLESSRFQQPEEQGPFVDYVRSLFAGRTLDLIVTMGAPATLFVQRYRPQFFPSTPMIIGAPEQRAIKDTLLTSNDTVVAVTLDFGKWIENILDVLPDTTHIAWAVGASPLERFWTEQFRRTSEAFAHRVTFEWFNDLSFEDMLKRVSVLPPKSAIFYVDLRMDAAGVPLDSTRVLARLHEAANAPIFSYIDSYLGEGIVGGPLLSSKEVGGRIAAVAVRILGGEPAGSIKIPPLTMGAPAYDWRELNRWNISERQLPPKSVVLFREPNLWESYRPQILTAFVALLVQATLIGWLIHEYRRRQKAEIQSRNSMAELTYMNRRATVGELSASIAHEVNQPLSGITTRAGAALRWLAAEPPDLAKVQAALTHIVDAGHRASDIVSSVRAMFRKDTQEKVPVDVNQLIRSVVGLAYIDMRKHSVELRANLGDALPPIAGNQVQLQQVILNLVMNAIEAMSSVEPRLLSIKSEVTEHGTVHVSIEDTGSGIDPSDMDRIFKPLFTTKARGMGMGLSICRSIIESHNGRIWVEPAADRGSIFQFELPSAVSSANPIAPSAANARGDAEDAIPA